MCLSTGHNGHAQAEYWIALISGFGGQKAIFPVMESWHGWAEFGIRLWKFSMGMALIVVARFISMPEHAGSLVK